MQRSESGFAAQRSESDFAIQTSESGFAVQTSESGRATKTLSAAVCAEAENTDNKPNKSKVNSLNIPKIVGKRGANILLFLQYKYNFGYKIKGFYYRSGSWQ